MSICRNDDVAFKDCFTGEAVGKAHKPGGSGFGQRQRTDAGEDKILILLMVRVYDWYGEVST